MGWGLILVERKDGYETSDIEKMGLNSQSTAQVSFQDVRVPKTNLMVAPGEAMKTLFISRRIASFGQLDGSGRGAGCTG